MGFQGSPDHIGTPAISLGGGKRSFGGGKTYLRIPMIFVSFVSLIYQDYEKVTTRMDYYIFIRESQPKPLLTQPMDPEKKVWTLFSLLNMESPKV